VPYALLKATFPYAALQISSLLITTIQRDYPRQARFQPERNLNFF
jgi:hypothetical protein